MFGLLIAGLTLFVSVSGRAQNQAGGDKDLPGGGALPKGDVTKADRGRRVTKKPSDEPRRSCLADFMTIPGGGGVFAVDGSSFYLLTTQATVGKPNGYARLGLYKVMPKTRTADLLLTLDHRVEASLITYGEPVAAVTAVSFAGAQASCNEGPAGLVSASFIKKNDKAVQVNGAFELLAGPRGPLLADQTKRQIVEMDSATFQTKLSRRFRAAERPLFFDPHSRRMVTWYDDGKHRGLVDYSPDEAAKPRRLSFKPEDKLVQYRDQFAVARVHSETNSIEIRELASWSGVANPGTYTMSLPAAHSATNAALSVHFKRRLALVHGANLLAKKRWAKAMLYDYAKGKVLKLIPADTKSYLGFAALDPTGSYAVFEWRDIANHQTRALKVYDIASNSFAEIVLPKPKI